MAKKKVGCMGIVVVDMFCGPMQALPAEGQLTCVDQMPWSVGGCAANVAIDLAKQGVEVDVIGCLGKDLDANMLRSCLKEHGISCDRLIEKAEYPTSKTVVLLVAGQDRRYIHMFGANGALTINHLDHDWLAELSVFYLGGLFATPKVDIDELSEVLAYCRERGIVTVIDVVVPHQGTDLEPLKSVLPQVDFIIPNDDEARQITGQNSTLDQVRYLRDLGATTVIVTKGCHGVMAARGKTFWECPAYSMPALDPSGAGDAFTSGIIAGILRQWELPRMLVYASALGASAVRAIGTTGSVFSSEEADAFVDSHPIQVISGTL